MSLCTFKRAVSVEWSFLYADWNTFDINDHACGHLNGGCEQIYVPIPSGRRCACWDGFDVVNEMKCFITMCKLNFYMYHVLSLNGTLTYALNAVLTRSSNMLVPIYGLRPGFYDYFLLWLHCNSSDSRRNMSRVFQETVSLMSMVSRFLFHLVMPWRSAHGNNEGIPGARICPVTCIHAYE